MKRKQWLLAATAVVLSLFLPALVLNPKEASATAELAAENALRTTLLQAIGGSILLAGLYVTWRTFDLNRKGHELDRQGQVTERFTRAIDQLGTENQLAVRLGGIYALERIARDSKRDHGPVIEVMNAFVRERAAPPETSEERPRPAADVEAAMRVIGRRNVDNDDKRIQLRFSRTDLRGVSLRGGHFERARFRHAHLEGAYLEGASLREAELQGAHLEGADLGHDDQLDLDGAHLEGAHLEGAHLTGAKKLEQAYFTGATYDEKTDWPRGFDYERACGPA
jgi:hypothetical protein